MTPDDAAVRLNGVANDIKMAGEGVSIEPLVHAAHQVAQQVRLAATRAGHSVAIRVVERGSSVRITVRGPQAVRYRTMASQELNRLLPNAQAEIRSQITRKV